MLFVYFLTVGWNACHEMAFVERQKPNLGAWLRLCECGSYCAWELVPVFLCTKPDTYNKYCRDSWFRLGMWHFRKSRCSALHGYVSPATRAFLCCPSHSLLCLRLVEILQKKVKPMYNSFMMKSLIPDPFEGLLNFQRLKYNYVYFSMPTLAHCPSPIMVAVCFERNSHAFLFLRFAYSY